MANKPTTDSHPLVHHHSVTGEAAHRAMKHLGATGQQSVAVDPTVVFAELQDEGPTARAPRQPAKR